MIDLESQKLRFKDHIVTFTDYAKFCKKGKGKKYAD